MAVVNWTSSLQDVITLTDPNATQVIASRLQDQVSHVQVKNLTDAIVDLTLEWSVQGAAFLTLSIIDPGLQLLEPPPNSPAGTLPFIQVDDAGLVVPLELNYPVDSDCYWWLVGFNAQLPDSSSNAANLTLTFEDRIVVKLRDKMVAMHANPGESMARFIHRCVAQVPGITFWAPSLQNEIAALKAAGITNPLEFAITEPNGPTGTATPVTKPSKSSTAKGASPARQNPTKSRGVAKGAGSIGNTVGFGAAAVVSQVIDLFNPPASNAGHGEVI